MKFSSQFAQVLPTYDTPNDDLIGEILVPAMQICGEARIGVGFFSSRCLAQIAPGLAAFVNYTDGILHMLVSPVISEEDQESIRRGICDPQTVVNDAMIKLFRNGKLSESEIERHTVDTLAYLLASNRLQMRLVLTNRGMYHQKIWLFRSDDDWLAVHGSGNATDRGLVANGEQMSIDRAWMDGKRSEERVARFLHNWERRWNNQYTSSLTLIPQQALEFLQGYAGSSPPTLDDFWEAWHRDHEAGLEPQLPPGYGSPTVQQLLRVPDSLVWREGRYAHQGAAVDALLDNRGGILSIATGGGKTRTALIAATELQGLVHKHMCVVILVPNTPLLHQWSDVIQEFNITPVVMSDMNRRKRSEELSRLSIAFGTDQPRTEVLLLTNALFTQQNSLERSWLEALPDSVCRLLVADEVHHLGARTFMDDLPEFFERRIGLSATPIRQYDPDGTDELFDFFGGPPVFEFTLREAIRSGCLVPYRYYIHVVEFDAEEMDYYEELTARLARAGFRVTDDGVTVGLTPRVASLLRERRALVEQAEGKLQALRQALTDMDPMSITKTLIYTSAKPTVMGKLKQITAVNRLLQELTINSHQYTADETGTTQSQDYLDMFGYGDYQVLTSMRVLDEGVDIPDTDTAFLLASSTVEREWVQRRGRILRNAPGKHFAHVHDFIVVPPDVETPAGKSLLRSELRRASAFADLAENEFDADGPSAIIRKLETPIWTV